MGKEVEVCLGCLEVGKWRKVEEKREKIELFFLLFYSSFLFFLNTFLRYCVTQYVKAQIKLKNALKMPTKGGF